MKYYCNPLNLEYRYQMFRGLDPAQNPEKCEVHREAADAVGANILWGYEPDKLYHSCLIYGKTSQKIGALVKGEPVYVRVDTFNEVGITEGETQKVC